MQRDGRGSLRQKFGKCGVALLTVTALMVVPSVGSPAGAAPPPAGKLQSAPAAKPEGGSTAATVPADVTALIAAGPADIILGVDPTPGTSVMSAAGGVQAGAAKLSSAVVRAAAVYSEEKQSALASAGAGVHTVRDFDSLPVQVVRVDTPEALSALATAPGVTSLAVPATYQSTVDPDLALIRQPEAQQAGYSGAGVVVAVIDTGTDYTRAGVGGAFGDCSQGPGTRSCRIDHLSDVSGTGLRDADPDGHGTNVSGIVAKTALSAHLDVYGVFNVGGTSAADGDILAALNSITTDGPARNVRAVNMSLGNGSRQTTECTDSVYSSAFLNLRALGILPIVAAGNDAFAAGHYEPGVSSPACATGAIRVGAVYAQNSSSVTFAQCSDHNPTTDQIACFSQGGPLVSLLAPGLFVNAAGITESGTSQASPHVAGAVADLVTANPNASAQQVARALTGTGRSITDPRDGLTVNRLDIAAAAQAVQVPGAEISDAHCADNSLPANDDGSTGSVPLPFATDFYGTTYQGLFVNNNGNVTFLQPQSQYTPFVIGADTPPMIAPFFADVDTRGAGSGLTTYGVTSYGSRAAFCVNWDRVGYYSAKTNKLNSFQLLIVDRGDVGAGDFDIVMNYGSINWETGDASGGTNGFGGTAAGAGFSAGDGVAAHFFQFPGSLTHLGLVDTNSQTGLVNSSRGSLQSGRYVFTVRNGLPPGSGTFTGTVKDNAGAPLALAPVQACPVAGGSCVVGVTGGDGHYTILGVGSGAWNLTALPPSGSSLEPGRAGPLTVGTGATVVADITLLGPLGIPDGTTITDRGQVGGVPVIYWTDDLALDTAGCVGGTGTYVIRQGISTLRSGPLTESPAGSGRYHATIAALYPDHGDARVTTSIACPGGASDSVEFTIYIDPSGEVVDASGRPISGATVTLLRADTSTGPFVAVPEGAAIMSPSNRSNPIVTGSDGIFHWDVLAGFYTVEASKPGCMAHDTHEPSAISAVYEVPPPALDIHLVLDCGAPTAPGAFTSLAPNRVLDTRTQFGAAGPVPAQGSISVQMTGRGGIPATGVSAVALNVTAVSPTSAGYITAWPSLTNRPEASNLNFSPGQNIPNMVIVPVGTDGKISLFNGSGGTVQLLADVAGYYLAGG